MAPFDDVTALEIEVKGESTPLSHISVAPFVDVTALEIEVKGESTPLNVVLHPYATH